ncbi:MAG: hypothetical protein ACI8WB_003511 [Phenylobacterium sp.]|jgi:hypothetical protein
MSFQKQRLKQQRKQMALAKQKQLRQQNQASVHHDEAASTGRKVLPVIIVLAIYSVYWASNFY